MLTNAIIVMIIFMVLTAVVFFIQRTLLYRPAKRGMSVDEADSLKLKKWPSAKNYRGYLSDCANAERTIILFHGNAGEAAGRSYYPAELANANARIILAEYPGYGTRTGSPSEEVIVSDAIETLKLIARTFPNEPLIVIGESMGSGVASAVAGRLARAAAKDPSASSPAPAIQGLLLITPWDSLVKLAETRFQFFPARWLVLDKYDSIKNLQSFDAPKAIVIAGRDKLIPAKHANRLFDNIPSLKKRYVIDTAGHMNWRDFVDDQWWQEILNYLSSHTNLPSAR